MNGEVPPGRPGALMDTGGAFGVAARRRSRGVRGAGGRQSAARLRAARLARRARAVVLGEDRSAQRVALRPSRRDRDRAGFSHLPVRGPVGDPPAAAGADGADDRVPVAGGAGRSPRGSSEPGRGAPIASGLAAAGAAIPVAILAAVCSSLVTLVFPSIGLRLEVDALSAALWAGALAAAGAGTGAYLEVGGRAGLGGAPRWTDRVRLGARAPRRWRVRARDPRAHRDPGATSTKSTAWELPVVRSWASTSSRSRRRARCSSRRLRVPAWRSSATVRCSILPVAPGRIGSRG